MDYVPHYTVFNKSTPVFHFHVTVSIFYCAFEDCSDGERASHHVSELVRVHLRTCSINGVSPVISLCSPFIK